MVGIPGARKFPETFCFQIIVSMKMAWYFPSFANTRSKTETGKKSKKKTIGKRIQNQKRKYQRQTPQTQNTTKITLNHYHPQKKRKKKRDTHTQQKPPSSISISISISTRNSPTSRPSRLHKNMSSIRHPIIILPIILPISISRSPPRSKRQSNRTKSIRIDFFQLHELCKRETFVAVVRGRHYFYLFIFVPGNFAFIFVFPGCLVIGVFFFLLGGIWLNLLNT